MNKELMRIVLRKILQLMILPIGLILKLALTKVRLISMSGLFYGFADQIGREKLKG